MIGMTIGDKVRLTFDNGTMSDKDYTIVRIINYKETHDGCDHYIVKGEDGVEQEIREWDCVYPPKTASYEDEVIFNFLNDNEVYTDVYAIDENSVQVHIEWGDWKHEHGWCSVLMGYLGWEEGDCIVTEEDGSDCYSADHYYYRKNK